MGFLERVSGTTLVGTAILNGALILHRVEMP